MNGMSRQKWVILFKNVMGRIKKLNRQYKKMNIEYLS